ncbi:hypothetical protein Cgig2_004853 [Carnegiea gigantea]|uniref:Tetratricopeptide repeat protein n=1 Tax=Carnegiea gigantea TaxID=171969 RepID=A0A9Q1KX18_9CARY|nr:hypothetical protein Cgig2_004853 [Carnegiea gigantea]
MVMEDLAIAINLNIAVCWLKLKEFELAKRQCDVVMNLDCSNVNARFRRAEALVNMGLKEDAYQDLLVALRFDPNNEEIKQELRRVQEMCNASNKKELFKEFEPAVNNIAESTSKEVAQADFDPLNLSDSSMFQASSMKSLVLNWDTSSPQLEETKSHLEENNSSKRTRMTVGELDKVDELSMGGCSSIGSNMDLDEQSINS